MQIIYGLQKIGKFKQPVVAIGVFDGVHRGHQRILKAASAKARAIGGTSMVLTFWPHPQKEESLYSLAHRLRLIAQLGIDVAVVINFSRSMAGTCAEDFIKDILWRKIGARYIYIGKDFRFGNNAKGNSATLKAHAKLCGYSLRVFKQLKINRRNISSTLIRTSIKKGNFLAAQKLLGRRVAVLGTVIKGASFARKLGFPTANINPHHEVLPPQGIYAVKAFLGRRAYFGACYIGKKPAFKAQSAAPKAQKIKNIEVHIFDFKKNLYGKDLEIQFIRKIRAGRKFSSPLKLAAQIKKDILTAKKIFSLP